MRHPDEGRTISSITCPECHGSMQEIVERELMRYRCHTGHAFTLEALVLSRRTHGNGRSTTPTALSRSGRWRPNGRRRACRGAEAERLQQRAQSYEEGADLLRDLIARGNRSGVAIEDSET